MIRCSVLAYRHVCKKRKYSAEECWKAVVREEGENVVVDEKHPSYPHKDGKVTKLSVQAGPGTELKALLKKVGIVASPGCSCNTRAKTMDENEAKEPGWCEKNLETICDWLQEEATKRKLPFVRMAAKILVRQAIRNARKKGQ